MPRYAFTDIHGCAKTFRHALRTIDLQPTDELYLLGDYIDRGPDSQGVLNTIWELQESGHRVVCLRGNHEEMLLDYMEKRQKAYEWVPEPEHFDRVHRWMGALPYYREIPGYLLVHAGFNFRHNRPLDDQNAMLWARYWYADLTDYWMDWLGKRVILHGHTPQTMITTKVDIREMDTRKTVCLDSGCAMAREGYGYLSGLNLDTREGMHFRRVD